MAVGDPSMWGERREHGMGSIAEAYAANGVRLTPANNSRITGWATVRRTLAHVNDKGDEYPPRLQVFRGACPNLVRTLPAMVRDPLDGEDLADAIKGVKTEDHDVDCLRYGLMAEAGLVGSLRQRDFNTGDVVEDVA